MLIAHRNKAPIEDLVSHGAVEAASFNEIARSCSIISLCLTGSPQVAATVAALKPNLAKGSVIVDCSTSDPRVTGQLMDELSEISVALADAP